jgi:hypothetical protein
MSFEVRNFLYLKVTPMRGLRCFKIRGKPVPRIFDPFKITKEREEELKAEFLNPFARSVRISRARFILRGVGLSHTKISNFGI